jgi:4-hydroxybenzoate polyprenyltransferase
VSHEAVSLRSYLRLMRIPNVFTSFANVVAGVSLARAGGFQPRDALLVLASGSLYCAGMVWNDYFDRHIDAEERPDRPIPSGEIAPAAAAAVGCVLGALGLGLAALHGMLPLLLAVLLSGAILLYDGAIKATCAGPLAMGGCRALNVLLGVSADPSGRGWLAPLALVLGIFTMLITQLSRFEVGGTEPQRLRATLRGFGALAFVAAIALVGFAWIRQAEPMAWIAALVAFSYVVWREQSLLRPLWKQATPPSLGRAIGGGILLMPAIDASFVAAGGAPLAAAATIAFMAPAWLLKRWYYLT